MKEKAMHKTDFLKCISHVGSMSVPSAARIYDALLAEMRSTLTTGGTVSLQGIGLLKPKIRKARDCHNPKNPAEKVHKPEHQTVVFKPAKLFMQIMNP